MRWVLCGLTFALAVALAVGTVAIRAENVRLRHRLESDYRRLEARAIELRRLSVQAAESVTPERLAAALHDLLRAAGARTGARAGSGEHAPWQ